MRLMQKGGKNEMSDTIYRQDAIDAAMQYCSDDDGTCSKADEDIRNLLDELEDLPPAQQTLYGYNIEHLAYIARVMQKEGVTAEYAVRTFDDMSRALGMIIEELNEKLEKALSTMPWTSEVRIEMPSANDTICPICGRRLER